MGAIVRFLTYFLSGATIQRWGEDIWSWIHPSPEPKPLAGVSVKTIFLVALSVLAGISIIWAGKKLKLKIFRGV
jgi:hypothetical protein